MVDYPKIRFAKVKKVKKKVTNFSKMNPLKKINTERANLSSTISKQLYGLYIILKSFEKENIYSNTLLETEYRVVIYSDG